jgi:iron(III) transport system substrate-binding protein
MTIRFHSLLSASLATVLACFALPAIAASVAEVANYMKDDRQAFLEAGARKEGVVQLYGTGTQDEPIYEAFRKKYPYIKFEAFRAGAVDVARRLLEETKANRYTADAIFLSTGALGELKKAGGILQPFNTPDLANFRDNAIEASHLWVYDYQSYLSLGWNTKEIKEADVPKTYDDLLDPKWKGKLYVSDWASTFAYWIGAAKIAKGEDYLLKLAQQGVIAYAVSPRAVANFVVSGEAPISPVIYSSHMANSKREGASVAWRALGPTFTQVGAVAVHAKAPHPHSAMLLLDFFLSKEMQATRLDLGYSTARTDMTNIQTPPDQVLDLPSRPNFTQEFEEWSALGLKVFGKGRDPAKK